jgi:hypothetical protein
MRGDRRDVHAMWVGRDGRDGDGWGVSSRHFDDRGELWSEFWSSCATCASVIDGRWWEVAGDRGRSREMGMVVCRGWGLGVVEGGW